MAFRKSRPWGNVKPPVGAQVDWGDPINKRRESLWLHNELASSRLFDVCGKNPMTTAATNAPTSIVSPWGAAKLYDHASNAAYKTGTSGHAFSLPFSFFAVCKGLYTDAYSNVFCTSTGASNDGIRIQNDKTWWAFVFGGVAVYTTNIAVEYGVWLAVSVTVDKAGGTLVFQVRNLNTCVTKSYTTAVGTPSLTTATSKSLGCWLANPSQTFSGIISHAHLWSRVLSPSEILRLYTEPFAGILAPRRNAARSLAVASGFIVSSAYQNGRVIGSGVF